MGSSSSMREGADPLGTRSSRLVSVKQAAQYLGVSTWTVRELEWSGVLPRVRIPLGNGKELRKLLFDREDLNRLIERWKDQSR